MADETKPLAPVDRPAPAVGPNEDTDGSSE